MMWLRPLFDVHAVLLSQRNVTCLLRTPSHKKNIVSYVRKDAITCSQKKIDSPPTNTIKSVTYKKLIRISALICIMYR
jgi:hypothetical protein